jgi:hypothetical protein
MQSIRDAAKALEATGTRELASDTKTNLLLQLNASVFNLAQLTAEDARFIMDDFDVFWRSEGRGLGGSRFIDDCVALVDATQQNGSVVEFS